MAEIKLDPVKFIKGYLVAPYTTEEWMEEAVTFKTRDTDVFIASFRKSGTHWLSYIVYLLIHKEKLSEQILSNQVYFFDIPQVDSFYDQTYGDEVFYTKVLKSTVANYPDPRMFMTHFPQGCLPQNPKAKYLYIYRNPKDTIISHYRYFTSASYKPFQGTFEDFFQIFIESNCFNFCKHFKDYLEHKDESNYFIISYEELKQDFTKKLSEIASFLGIELTEELYELIKKETSFESMKANPLIADHYMGVGKTFFPSGAVGTWQLTLTKEQSDKVDSILLAGLGEDILTRFPSLLGSKL